MLFGGGFTIEVSDIGTVLHVRRSAAILLSALLLALAAGCGGANPSPNNTGEPSLEPGEAPETSLHGGKPESTTPPEGGSTAPTTTAGADVSLATPTNPTTSTTTTTTTTATTTTIVIESEEPEDYFVTYQPST